MAKIKVRGLEIRKRDTPKFVFDVQTGNDQYTATANNIAELTQANSNRSYIVRKYRQNCWMNEVPILRIWSYPTHVKKPGAIPSTRSQVIAAKQLIKQGTEVHAGNSVSSYLRIQKTSAMDVEVKAAQLIEKGVEPDTEKYLQLFIQRQQTMLSFDDYKTELIYDSIRDKKTKKSSCDSEDCLWWSFGLIKSKRRYKNGRKIYSYAV